MKYSDDIKITNDSNTIRRVFMNKRRGFSIILVIIFICSIPFLATADSRSTVYRDDLGDVTGSASYPVYSTLNEALTAIGSANTTLFINRQLTATTCTVPANVELKFLRGGSISVNSGNTVTINGTLDASGLDSIFTGDGNIVMGNKIRTVHIEWFLPSGYVTDGSVDYSNYVNKAINSVSRGTVIFPAFVIKANVQINGKSDLRITGKGTILKPNGDSGTAIKLIGSCNNIIIDNLSITGDNSTVSTQKGIACDAGQALSNITIKDVTIRELNTGISFDAGSGSIDRLIITNNSIENIAGTDSGKGTGIYLNRAMNSIVSGNIIDGCSLYSILIRGNGSNSGNIINNNTIKNHRAASHDGNTRAAVFIYGTSGVTVNDNIFVDGYGGSIYISHGTSGSMNAHNIVVSGNNFCNRKDNVADITIGEMAVPGSTYYTKNILIAANNFNTDYSVSGGGSNILILNGRNIAIKDNQFSWANVNGNVVRCVMISHDAYIDSADDCRAIDATNNNFYAEGTDLSNFYGFYLPGEICSYDTPIRIKESSFGSIVKQLYFGGALTNPSTCFDISQNITYDCPEVPSFSTYDYIVTVNGAKPSSVVNVNPQGSIPSGMVITAFPHATSYNTVIIRFANTTGSAIDPDSMIFRINIKDD